MASPWRVRNVITCCKDCKPPKRYPGCGDHCEEYKAQKAKYTADKQREREALRDTAINDYSFNKRQKKYK